MLVECNSIMKEEWDLKLVVMVLKKRQTHKEILREHVGISPQTAERHHLGGGTTL